MTAPDRPGADEALAAVLATVRSQLPDSADPSAEIDPDAPLDGLGFDSLRTVRLLVEVEEALGVEFPPDLVTAETFRTARTLADAVLDVRTAR
ncbi:acyl carrier protein [Kitasatospora sp. NPDC085879]|uniref:acyl carrier protein n=1 Tax=Kitasatospora sp. NPDC085879 TaxID=3154769 RepID=UPI000BB11E2E|nr:acyl carrier protein [Streptomyces sp. TLI_235]PBC78960.1 acyl carrier protein [Streptomyces sp. TLI_235]